ncbi:MAG: hypothetical protein K6U14_09080 [Firmicutes bacterium]|nr:hypothetical protein [Alicyclobacillaceae bacterium]MCL6497764.1 hypothetical protein [Bacillota bacterium]
MGAGTAPAWAATGPPTAVWITAQQGAETAVIGPEGYQLTPGPLQGGYALSGTCGSGAACTPGVAVTLERGSLALLDGWAPAAGVLPPPLPVPAPGVGVSTGGSSLSSAQPLLLGGSGTGPPIAVAATNPVPQAGEKVSQPRQAAHLLPADAGVWPPSTSVPPGWTPSVTLTPSTSYAAVGQTVTFTASYIPGSSAAATQESYAIFDETTGQLLGTCSSNPCTVTATSTQTGRHTYMAVVDEEPLSLGEYVTWWPGPVPPGIPADWSPQVALTANAAVVPAGQPVTLTATLLNPQSVGGWYTDYFIVDGDTGQEVGHCTDNPCTVSVTSKTARQHEYWAIDTNGDPVSLGVLVSWTGQVAWLRLQADPAQPIAGQSVMLSVVPGAGAPLGVVADRVQIVDSATGQAVPLQQCQHAQLTALAGEPLCTATVSQAVASTQTYQAIVTFTENGEQQADESAPLTVTWAAPQVPWLTLTAHPAQPTAGQAVTLTAAVANGPAAANLVHSPWTLQIVDSATGQALASCGDSTQTCTAQVSQAAAGSASYAVDLTTQAGIAATSASLTVAWAPAPASWLTLTASPAQPTAGQAVTLTAAPGPDIPQGIQIWSLTSVRWQIVDTATGHVVGQCFETARCTATVSQASPGPHTYQAVLDLPQLFVAQGLAQTWASPSVTVTWAAPQVPWLTLTASPAQPAGGAPVTLTATLNLSQTNPWAFALLSWNLAITDTTTGQTVATCDHQPTTCTAQVTPSGTGSQTYQAIVTASGLGSTQTDASAPVTVTWPAPSPCDEWVGAGQTLVLGLAPLPACDGGPVQVTVGPGGLLLILAAPPNGGSASSAAGGLAAGPLAQSGLPLLVGNPAAGISAGGARASRLVPVPAR